MLLLPLSAERVAPCEGSVDWNLTFPTCKYMIYVAPCEGSVDWNRHLQKDWPNAGRSLPVRGAWIEIPLSGLELSKLSGSLPVRGAWIEIPKSNSSCKTIASLPVRGAWIEIPALDMACPFPAVAPCEGSVDWNVRLALRIAELKVAPCEGSVDWNRSEYGVRDLINGRSLWGERGLKFVIGNMQDIRARVAPCEGSVDWNIFA